MDKKKPEHVRVEPEAPAAPAAPLPCAVCGQYDGEMVPVVGAIRTHAACASARPDVIATVKARAGG